MRTAKATASAHAKETLQAQDSFDALADATRRGILDLLRTSGVLTAGEIAVAFPQISRPAVSRHLRVLREAGLVIAEEIGREWHYRLNVAALARVHRDWFARFTPLWERSLEQLKDQVEGAAGRSRRRGA
jgi:DNA-binding transcriptional ArsR family regulator